MTEKQRKDTLNTLWRLLVETIQMNASTVS